MSLLRYRLSAFVVMFTVFDACSPRLDRSGVSQAEPAASLSYVGRQVCAECHQKEDALWQGSDHRLAMQPADSHTVLGDFTGSSFTSHGSSSDFFRQDGNFAVRTDGPDGRLHHYKVAYTFGVSPLQQYLIEFPRGRYQALSVAWDARPKRAGGQRWYQLYPDERIDFRDALHWTGLDQDWNYMCADCHSTNVRKNYSFSNDGYATRWSEINVSCEACHGPGSGHEQWAREARLGRRGPDPLMGLVISLKDTTGGARVMAPAGARERDKTSGGEIASGASRAEVEVCGVCHSRRLQIWPDHDPGHPLADTYRVATLDDGLYEPDGQQLGEVYEYGSFLQSRMYSTGVTCSNCHDPHSGRLPHTYNTLCTQCHQPTKYDVPSHHFHKQATEAAQCVSCHMPKRYYMVVDGRRDHRFQVPRPDESLRFGTPNACTGCHKKRGHRWAANAVTRWYGPRAAQRPSFTQALAAGRARLPWAVSLLATLVRDAQAAGIVRATAVALLTGFPDAQAVDVISLASRDRDPLVRRAAASVLLGLEPVTRSQIGGALLSDSVRTVRIEAVLPMAAVPERLLPLDVQHALKRSEVEFRAAQEFNADRPEAHANLAALDVALGRYQEAEVAYRTAIRMQPQFVPAYVNLADVQRATGREEEAEQTLRTALTVLPDAPAIHHALGLALVRQKRMKDALVEIARAVELAPSNPRYAYVYGVALHDAGDLTGALKTLEKASKFNPGDFEILQALVSFNLRAGKVEQARDWAQRIRAAAPGGPSTNR